MDLDRHDWLAMRYEEAHDPHRRIIDPHHHLWDRGGSTYLADELLADTTTTHKVTHTVFVECLSKYNREAPKHLQPVGETEFVAAQAAETRRRGGTVVAGIVAFADMSLGSAVEEVLAAHEEAAGGLFKGIRHATAWSSHEEVPPAHTKPTEGLMETAGFRSGVAKLGAMGYSFDAWMYHHQLDELTALARELPTVPIILNHLGAPLGIGPYRNSADVDLEWKKSMTDLAACANVSLKIGGIGMDQYFALGWVDREIPPGSDEVADRWRGPVQWCIEAFGPERCMFESNYPVDRQTLTYPVLWNSFQKIVAEYSDAEQDLLFWGTAQSVYRLEDQ